MKYKRSDRTSELFAIDLLEHRRNLYEQQQTEIRGAQAAIIGLIMKNASGYWIRRPKNRTGNLREVASRRWRKEI